MAIRDIVLMGFGSSYYTFIATCGYGPEPTAEGTTTDYRPRSSMPSSDYRKSLGTQDACRKSGGETSSCLKAN